MARNIGFVGDTSGHIVALLQLADNWSALKEEYAAMQTNGVQITQADVDAVFGVNGLTLAQYNAALAAVQTLLDSIHAPATAAKLYRLKR